MSGMDMMLKSFGINVDEMKQQFANYGNLVLDLHSRMVRIETKLDQILSERKDANGKQQPAGPSAGSSAGGSEGTAEPGSEGTAEPGSEPAGGEPRPGRHPSLAERPS